MSLRKTKYCCQSGTSSPIWRRNRRELIRRRIFAEGDEGRVARQEAQGDEDERQDEEHRRHGIEQSRSEDARIAWLPLRRRLARLSGQ